VTARLMLALGGGAGLGAVAWAALFLLFGPGGVFAREGGRDGLPEIRSADAHPDAPVRKPIMAGEDLGLPMAAPFEQPLPRDLDQPLAAFHPNAIPESPREPARAPAPTTAPAPAPAGLPLKVKPEPLAPGERIESFEISQRHAAESGVSSIDALLARLERGTVARRRELGRAG
jgi:hypothetical protein